MDDRKKSVLRITPPVLNFPPPLNTYITNILKLHNTSSESYLAYKVKTTAPNRYCVRPSVGLIPPGEEVEVQVIFNPNKDPPTNLSRCKDKFQVLSIVADGTADLKELFRTTSPEHINQQKLRCRFAAPVFTSEPLSAVPPPDPVRHKRQRSLEKEFSHLHDASAHSSGDSSGDIKHDVFSSVLDMHHDAAVPLATTVLSASTLAPPAPIFTPITPASVASSESATTTKDDSHSSTAVTTTTTTTPTPPAATTITTTATAATPPLTDAEPSPPRRNTAPTEAFVITDDLLWKLSKKKETAAPPAADTTATAATTTTATTATTTTTIAATASSDEVRRLAARVEQLVKERDQLTEQVGELRAQLRQLSELGETGLRKRTTPSMVQDSTSPPAAIDAATRARVRSMTKMVLMVLLVAVVSFLLGKW